ncbi:hypothetical protein CCACVL1_00759 [Corchorus capsularis]|uniref:Uncharacterized protein n=1 Tax=Corchorus capsularis TaxID=210143 RepID=A0A1R3KUU8_COCAP|nr:hypothetical protein CCACVL1_00759 [Corchorus capsularis]
MGSSLALNSFNIGLAMEEACELGTPLWDLHRLDKEFKTFGAATGSLTC